jgi:type VI secretion system secreted protein VgrG
MRLRALSVLLLVLVLPFLAVSAYADTFAIGTAAPFAILGEAGVTNTGPSVIFGSVAGSAGTPAVTGFPPGLVIAPGVLITTGVANSGPGTPFGDATAAYLAAQNALGATPILTDLGGLTLTPGVYSFSSTAQLTGILLLDAQGSNTAQWIFQIGSGLTTASASTVQVINAGAGPFTGGITWQVTSAAILGTTTTFLGTIISQAGIVLETGATIGCGRAISLNASVTLDSNIVSNGCQVTAGTGGNGGTITPPAPVPEPGTFGLFAVGLGGLLTLRKLL